MTPVHKDTDSKDVPIIETAAGTTSPTNSQSGKTAYVIAAVAIVLCALMGTAVSGCMSTFSAIPAVLGQSIGEEYEHGPFDQFVDDQTDENWDDEYVLDDDWHYNEDAFIDDLGIGSKEPLVVKDILGEDLNMYWKTIDAALPASAYANAEATVRVYARELVIIDRDASSELTNLLRNASWRDKDLSEEFEKASTLVQTTIETLQQTEVPTAEGGNAEEVIKSLEEGKSTAIARWEAISKELELLSANDTVDYEEFSEADGAVATATYDAASSLMDALSNSAKR